MNPMLYLNIYVLSFAVIFISVMAKMTTSEKIVSIAFATLFLAATMIVVGNDKVDSHNNNNNNNNNDPPAGEGNNDTNNRGSYNNNDGYNNESPLRPRNLKVDVYFESKGFKTTA